MSYTVTPTAIPDVLILEPKVFGDSRGFFLESFNAQNFAKATGLNVQFVQDNHSRSAKSVLRGLHYQLQQTQGKLLQVGFSMNGLNANPVNAASNGSVSVAITAVPEPSTFALLAIGSCGAVALRRRVRRATA